MSSNKLPSSKPVPTTTSYKSAAKFEVEEDGPTPDCCGDEITGDMHVHMNDQFIGRLPTGGDGNNDYLPPGNPTIVSMHSMKPSRKASMSSSFQLEGSGGRRGDGGQIGIAKIFVPSILMDADFVPPQGPNDKDDLDDCRESIDVARVATRTLVSAVVIDTKVDECNIPMALKCYGGVAFGGYPYDQNQDAYIVRCVDCVQIGGFSFGFRYTMKGIGDWKQNVPIPGKILLRHMSPAQRAILQQFKERYPEPKYRIEFVQMVNAN